MGMKGMQEVVNKVGHMFESSGDRDAIDLLKADHRKVEELFSQFEKAGSATNKQSILDQIIKELSIHATIEENLVYPLLEDSRKVSDKTAEAYEEHHVVKMMLAELADIPAEKEIVKAKVCVLREMVRHHVKEEELGLLPQLKKSGADLERLGADIQRRKQQLMTGVARGGDIGKNRDRKAIASSASVRKSKSGLTEKSAAGGKVQKNSTGTPKMTSTSTRKSASTAQKKSAAGKSGARARKMKKSA